MVQLSQKFFGCSLWQIVSKEASLIIYALREAFLSLVPYLVVSSLSTLLFQAFILFAQKAHVPAVSAGIELLQNVLPLLILLVFSYQYGKAKGISGISASLLALSIFLSYYPLSVHDEAGIWRVSNISVYALIIPILSGLIFTRVFNSRWLMTPKYAAIDESVRTIYRYTPAFIVSYACVILLLVLSHNLFYQMFEEFASQMSSLNLSTESMLFLRTIASHLMTYVGVHGTNIYDLLVDPVYLKYTVSNHFSAKNALDTFVIFGGVGASLALAFAVILTAKDQHAVRISKVSLPFLMFNVTEILLYGLPIVFNRKLFIPFLMVPLLNLGLILALIHIHAFDFVTTQLPWTTPIFLNAFLATGGNWLAVFYQLAIFCLDTWIYSLFVRGYVNTQSSTQQFIALRDKLNITENVQTRRSVKFQQAQSFLVNSHYETQQVIELITSNQLVLVYQPIVDIKNKHCFSFEALLRLKMTDGTLRAPTFLPTLEQAGLSSVIDVWVSQQLQADLQQWQLEGFRPLVSMNVHPDSFLDPDVMRLIFNQLQGYQVQFEVIERAFLDKHQVQTTLELLKAQGFKLALDDFGTGYSTLEHLQHTHANTIKFDKLLLDATSTSRGFMVYFHASQMCHDIGLPIVAEGVETAEQLEIVYKAGIQYVQGWYFSKALPRHAVLAYQPHFEAI